MTVCFCFCYSSSYPQQMILEILINVTFCTLYICYFYAYALWAFKDVQNLFMPEKLSMIDWWQILLTLQLILHLCSHTSPLNEAAQMDSGDESSVTTPESWKCPFHYFKSVYCCVIQWLVTWVSWLLHSVICHLQINFFHDSQLLWSLGLGEIVLEDPNFKIKTWALGF